MCWSVADNGKATQWSLRRADNAYKDGSMLAKPTFFPGRSESFGSLELNFLIKTNMNRHLQAMWLFPLLGCQKLLNAKLRLVLPP
jgi:hypothetical protein